MRKMLPEMLKRRVGPEELSFGKIFVGQAILFFAIYGIMLIPRFSTDSYSVYFYTNDSVNVFLTSGRGGTFLLYKALLALGINSVVMSPAFTAVFCLTLAWSASVLLSRLKDCFPRLDWLTLLFLEMAVVLAFANIYMAELFFFSDVALVYSLNILFMVLAVLSFFHKNRIIGTGLSLLCLCCSLSFYQASLGMFMALSSMLLLVKHDVLWTGGEKHGVGTLVRELVRLAAVGGAASVVTVLGTNLLGAAGFYSDRSPSLNPADIMNSIQQLFRQYLSYYSWGYPNYLTGLLKIVFILSGPVLLFLLADSFDRHSNEHYPLFAVIITLLVLIADFLLVFAPHFLSQSVWVTPRSIYSFFAVFSLMAVVMGYNYARNGKSISLIPAAIMLLFIIANIVGIQLIALDQIEVNRLDRQEAEEIVRCIEEYERESGQTVNMISWCSDESYTATYPGIKYVFMDMNVKASARSWSLPDCISYYAGRRLRSEPMPVEIWMDYFAGQDWDSFQPEEQIYFEGSTMYLMTY